MQNVGEVPNWAYQSTVYAAQDEESKDSLMQEMRCRKGNVGTHSTRMPSVGKDKDADLGLCQDLEQIKKASLSGIMDLSKGAGPLKSPYEFKWEGLDNVPVGLSPGVPMGTHLAKKKSNKIYSFISIPIYCKKELRG